MSKNIIFWFSGTGNSLKAAKDIASGLSDCALFSMAGNPAIEGECERIGFVFPLYCFRIPHIVRRFIERLDMSAQKNAYIFAVVLRGGRIGNDLPQVNEILSAKSLRLSYGAKVHSAGNCVILHPVPPSQVKYVEKQDREIQGAIRDVSAKRESRTGSKNPLLELVYKAGMKDIPGYDRKFFVNEACASCGLCAKICPASNIEMADGKPVFKHHCELCLACINWCPQRAINTRSTKKRGRYHNPNITSDELARPKR